MEEIRPQEYDLQPKWMEVIANLGSNVFIDLDAVLEYLVPFIALDGIRPSMVHLVEAFERFTCFLVQR
jgi:hypothetical protein